jgi:hypothetical protein
MNGALVETPEILLDLPAISAPSAVSEPGRTLVGRLAFPLSYVLIAALLAGLFFKVVKINSGTFLYTLDDPYIHLALSDQIRHGNYGLYPGTHAAPSSSILYPFLLAPASGTRLHPWLPLVLNLCGLIFTLEVIRRFLRHLHLGENDFAVAVQAGALVMAALCFNLIGVVFTGLEHSLHLAMIAATIYGLALFLDRGRLPSWLPAVLVLSPLLRYEGVALSLGVLLVLAIKGRVRTALATFAVMSLLLGGFSAFLLHLGLPPLPSSILSKSAIAAGSVGGGHGSFAAGFVQNVDTTLGHPIGLILLLVGVIVAVRFALELSERASQRRPWTSNGLMSLPLLCLLAGQAVAGRYGWMERYEIYAILGTALIAVYLGRTRIREVLAPGGKHRLILVGAAASAVFIFGTRYIFATSQVPLAANNVYEQQFQMHTFIDRYYRGPVAVNDIGLVTYHNPWFVLDLGGLGSEKARLLSAARAPADTYQEFVAANHIHLVMIYDEWFAGRIPASWKKVATLSLSRLPISAARSNVHFYVTDAATEAAVRQELTAFRRNLPASVKFTAY